MVCWRPHLAGTRQYIWFWYAVTKDFILIFSINFDQKAKLLVRVVLVAFMAVSIVQHYDIILLKYYFRIGFAEVFASQPGFLSHCKPNPPHAAL